MKTLTLIVILIASNAFADNACEKPCNDVTKDQKACVLKNYCKVRTKIVEKVVYRAVSKNSVSIVALATPNKLNVQQSPSSFSASTSYQADVGLMYQRDLTESIRGSVGASIQGNAWLGLGYNF